MIVGIDASNIRSGGGITHLKNLMHYTNQDRDCIHRIVLWSSPELASQLPDSDYVDKQSPRALEHSLVYRIRWQQLRLPTLLRDSGVEVLLSPGGTVPFNSPVPCVTMFQNALPFEKRERVRFEPLTAFRIKLELLRAVQTASMRRSEGLICLTDYAASLVRPLVGPTPVAIVPHGIEDRFFCPPRHQEPFASFTEERPFRFVYVSPVYSYKHHLDVAIAVDHLRLAGFPITIDFIGELAESRAVGGLLTALDSLSNRDSIRLLGPVPFDDLHRYYSSADGFVFASSCENLPNTLLEAMAAGLPIASSSYPPMPEVLGDGGVLFDPESISGIALAMERLVRDDGLRARISRCGYSIAQTYSWDKTAEATWSFVANTLRDSSVD